MDEDREEVSRGPLLDILSDPVGVLRRRWLPIVAVVVAGWVATVAVVALLKPQYEARATVMIASQKLSEEFVRPTIEEDLLERINALIAEALSRESLSQVIERRNLYPELRAERSMVDAVAALRDKIEVEVDPGLLGATRGGGRAQVIAIRYTAQDPEVAADVTNEVAGLFAAAGVRLRTEQVRLTTDFMKRELADAEEVLHEQMRKISEFQQQHRGELPSELESHLRRLERLQQQRNSLALQITEAETRVALSAAEASAPDSPSLRLRELRSQLAKELSVNKETHPNVVSLRRQIELAEGELGSTEPSSRMGASQQILLRAGREEIAQLRNQLAETDRELMELDARVAAIPAREEELTAMLQRATVLRDNYLDFLRKVKESELAESLEMAQQGDRVSVLDRAFPPADPKQPRWMLALGGIVASLGLGLMLGLALELRDPVIVSADALESLTGLRVLGSVPHMR